MVDAIPEKNINNNKNIIIGIIVGIIIVLTIFIFVIFSNNKESKKIDDMLLVVSVEAQKKDVKSITYSPLANESTSLKENSTATLNYRYEDDEDHGIKWVISDSSVAEINGNKITGKKAGTITVYGICEKNENIKSNTVTLTFD